MSPLQDLLARSPWTRDLTAEQKRRVEADTTARFVAAGGYACRCGERVDHWVGVIDGLVKVAAVSPEGKETTFIGVTAGGWFGEGSLLKDEPRRYDGIALRDSHVAYLPRATFRWLLDTSIGFNHYVLTQINERLSQIISMVASDRLLEPDARVAHCLASLYHPTLYPGTGRTLAISQEEIGFLAGLSRQRVNHSLKNLEGAGLLRIEHVGITVLDVEQLKAFPGKGG